MNQMAVYSWEISMVGRILWTTYRNRKILVGKALLNYNEMVIVATEIEGCLNSRPLTFTKKVMIYQQPAIQFMDVTSTQMKLLVTMIY